MLRNRVEFSSSVCDEDRERVAVVTRQCAGCITTHTTAAIKQGATREEIIEALGVAIAVFETPLVLVAVDERILSHGKLGARIEAGVRSFHLLVVNERSRSRLGALAFGALARGLDEFVRDAEIEVHLVSEITVVMRHRTGTVAIDGELIQVTSPLRYEFKRGAANVVCRE